jgi:hypothetical protein
VFMVGFVERFLVAAALSTTICSGKRCLSGITGNTAHINFYAVWLPNRTWTTGESLETKAGPLTI